MYNMKSENSSAAAQSNNNHNLKNGFMTGVTLQTD